MSLFTWKHALKQTFGDPYGWSTFIVSSIGLFLLLLLIPVWTTPGNDIYFQMKLLGISGMIPVVLLSIGNGLLLTMRMVIRHIRKHNSAAKHVADATTLSSILISSLAATLACAACYSSILALLGVGATAFIVNNRVYFAIFSLILTAAALHYSVRTLNNACATCHI